ALLEHLQDVPGDRLALAVRVGGEDELVGALDRLGDVAEALLRLAVDLPDHLEVALGVDRAVLGGQVAPMAERGQHLIAPAEVFIGGCGLGGGLDDDDVHAGLWVFMGSPDPSGAESGAGDAGKMGKSTLGVKSAAVIR